MHTRSTFFRWKAIAVSVISISLVTASVIPAYAVQGPEELLDSDCIQGLALVADSEMLKSSDLDPEQELNFTCVGPLTTVHTQEGTSRGEAVSLAADVSENIVVDTLATSDATTSALSTSDEVLDFPVSPDDETISGVEEPDPLPFPVATAASITEYRANKTEKLVWGKTTTSGSVLWKRSASITLRSEVGTMKTAPLNISVTPGGKYPIAFSGTGYVYEHKRLAVDPVMDVLDWRQDVYSSGTWSKKRTMIHNGGAAKYYHKVKNMTINDRDKKERFNIAWSITMPRFQCYKTVNCKFPKGKEAPY